jgi:hypothetical protein
MGAHPDAELAVGELELFAVDLGAAEGSPGGAVGGVGLNLTGAGGWAQGVLFVGVAAEFAPCGDGGGSVLPFLALGERLGHRPERVGEPARRFRGELVAELGASPIGGVR